VASLPAMPNDDSGDEFIMGMSDGTLGVVARGEKNARFIPIQKGKEKEDVEEREKRRRARLQRNPRFPGMNNWFPPLLLHLIFPPHLFIPPFYHLTLTSSLPPVLPPSPLRLYYICVCGAFSQGGQAPRGG
jgi:hypothetical protein